MVPRRLVIRARVRVATTTPTVASAMASMGLSADMPTEPASRPTLIHTAAQATEATAVRRTKRRRSMPRAPATTGASVWPKAMKRTATMVATLALRMTSSPRCQRCSPSRRPKRLDLIRAPYRLPRT